MFAFTTLLGRDVQGNNPFKATINEQSLKIAAAAPSSSTAVVRNFFTDIEALKGIGVADNKLLQAHSKADNHNPGSPVACSP